RRREGRRRCPRGERRAHRRRSERPEREPSKRRKGFPSERREGSPREVSGANRPTKTTAIDLFCGAGGVTTGYKAAGIHVIAAIDNDPNARRSYGLNHPEVKLFDDDIHELDPTVLMARLGLRPGGVGILTACGPWQRFSS